MVSVVAVTWIFRDQPMGFKEIYEAMVDGAKIPWLLGQPLGLLASSLELLN